VNDVIPTGPNIIAETLPDAGVFFIDGLDALLTAWSLARNTATGR
jgi:hypothetical protein